MLALSVLFEVALEAEAKLFAKFVRKELTDLAFRSRSLLPTVHHWRDPLA